MKKINLMVMLCIISTAAICQSYYKIHSNTKGVWNINAQIYDWGTRHYVEMDLTIKGNIILITDDAGSSYVTGTLIDNEDNYTCKQFAWNATDEKNRKCMIKLRYPKYNGDLTGRCELYVIYNDYAYAYDVSDN